MILNNASDIKVGSQQVVEVRAGTELVWPATSGDFWTFDTPIGGEEIEVIATFTGAVSINWGDGDTDILVSLSAKNHTY